MFPKANRPPVPLLAIVTRPPEIWGTNGGLEVPDSHTDEYIHFQTVTLPRHEREVVAAAAKAAGVTIIWHLKLSMQNPTDVAQRGCARRSQSLA